MFSDSTETTLDFSWSAKFFLLRYLII